MATRIQLRGDTATHWSTVNPTLAERELAIETDTYKIKLGNGITDWNNLDYLGFVNVVDYGAGRLIISDGTSGGLIAISGLTFSNISNTLTLDGSLSATTYYGDGSNLTGVVTNDTFVTGFTQVNYDLIIEQNQNQVPIKLTLPPYITGYTDNYVTGGTYSDGTLTLERNDGVLIQVTGLTSTDTFVTGFTYDNSNNLTISRNQGQPDLTINISIMTGLTINGDASVNNLTASTINKVNYIDFDITQTGTTASEGRLFWDVNNRTLSLGMIGGPVQQIGEEQYYLVENQTSTTIGDGSIVRAVGTSGASGKILIDKMIANGTIPAFTTLGVLTQPLNSGDTGYVTSFGLVRGIDTTGALYSESWNQGDILYVSPTILGGFTKVKPITPNQDIIIAIVMEVGLSGALFVRPDVYRPFKDPNRIIVAKQNGDFTSIKDAVDSITTSSSSNRYVIDVGPGEFIEGLIDLSSKPYISIVGSNIQTTLVIPLTPTQHILSIGIDNEISFLSFSGAGSGYAAIYCNDIGDFGQAHKISIYDCDIGILNQSTTKNTSFYGEYVDINGSYSYGVKSIANNGYTSLINLENYYLFAPTIPNAIGNYLQGSGSTINITSSLIVGNSNTGSTALYILDGGFANISATDITNWGTGLLIPVATTPSSFEFDGVTFSDNTLDIDVKQTTASGVFLGISNHEKVQSLSPDIYWNFLDSEDGELDITRKGSVTFADGTHTDFTTLIFEGSTMGLMDGGLITVVSATTINIAAGYGYLETSTNVGIIKRIDWNGTNLTLSTNTENYIFFNDNGILSIGGLPNTIYSILLGRVVTNATGVEFIDQSPQDANHTSNKFSKFNRTALGPVYATGSIVSKSTTPFAIDVTAGNYFFSENQFLPSGGNNITFTQYYRNGISGWTTSATTGVTNAYYDDNGSLSVLTGYTKHTLYVVGDGVDEKYFLVVGQKQFPTLIETEGELLPTPPTYFSDSVTTIASIYVQGGTSGITQIQDIRPIVGFKATGVNASAVHGNLLGLSADDHIQYLLVNGGRSMTGNLNMGGNDITNVNLVDGVDVPSHASRHKFGGADPVGTGTPTASAIPYADLFGRLDSWISTATTSTLGLVTLSTSPTSPSNPIVVGENDLRFQNAFTGASFNDLTDTLTLNRIDGTSLLVTGFTDYYVTGGTYSNGTLTLNRQNGFVTITGLTSTDTFVTGFTNTNGLLTISQNQGQLPLTADTTQTRLISFNSNDMALGTATRTILTPLVISVTRFDGTGAIDDAGLSFIVPQDYLSTPEFYFTWRASTTSSNTAKIFLDIYTGDTNDLGSLITIVETTSIADTPTTANVFLYSPSVTPTTPIKGNDTIHLRIYRDPGDTGDTFTGTLDMINFVFRYKSKG